MSNGVYHRMVPTRYGPMLVNTHDHYVGGSLIQYGEFSPGEAMFFRKLVKPGWTVMECGANIGAHTILLARLVGEAGRVIAFEPQRLVYQTLVANVALQCAQNVWPYWAAVGNRTGQIQVARLDPCVDNNFGGLEMGNKGEGLHDSVALLTLDAFAELPHVEFVKIDVEGMESDVLDGGRRLIAKHRPILYVENDRAHKSEGLLALLGALDYTVWKHDPPLFTAENFNGDPENRWPGIVSHNLIGVPTERAHEFEKPDAAE